ncbi:MAG: hypothetical protein HZC29_01220 [Thaumarchaeota archaeon]|nr:hypothetical protein [Nitrososphaerota archaeon]
MFDIDVIVTGWEEEEYNLQVLDVRISQDFPVEGMKWILERSLTYADQMVPVRTGKLKRSLKIMIDEENKEGMLYSDVDYSIYVEVGTSKMTAQPYLVPALLRAIADFKREFPNLIAQVIEK